MDIDGSLSDQDSFFDHAGDDSSPSPDDELGSDTSSFCSSQCGSEDGSHSHVLLQTAEAEMHAGLAELNLQLDQEGRVLELLAQGMEAAAAAAVDGRQQGQYDSEVWCTHHCHMAAAAKRRVCMFAKGGGGAEHWCSTSAALWDSAGLPHRTGGHGAQACLHCQEQGQQHCP